ncbi:MAG TPA: hypothetical protein VG368_07555 [Acidimicrobiales bacterium]|jgi:hypothetical protein|nr:hypothetical protein [Acidimicrobiales bacterium]
MTLRGLLLIAYAFGQMGTIADGAAITAFVLARIMMLLVVSGLRHFRTVSETEEFGHRVERRVVPISA